MPPIDLLHEVTEAKLTEVPSGSWPFDYVKALAYLVIEQQERIAELERRVGEGS